MTSAGNKLFTVFGGGGLPYPLDLDAAAYITANSLTDAIAINRVDRTIRLLKEQDVWDSLTDGFLLGSKFQASSTTLQSLKLSRTASGTSTFNEWGATFNGSSNGYTFENANQETASSGFAWMTFHQHDYTQGRDVLLGSYNPPSARGPYMSIGYSPGSEPDSHTDLRLYSSTDGSAEPSFAQVDDSVPYDDWATGFVEWDGTSRRVNLKSQGLSTDTPASIYHNYATMGLGKSPNNALYFDGRILAALVWSAPIGNTKYLAIRQGLREIFSSTIPFYPAVIFEGNSLTAAATGGGSTWPAKLLAKSGWSSNYLDSQNYAVSGEEQVGEIEPRLSTITSAWAPYGSEDRLLILWSGTNDITAGTGAQDIIDSLERYGIAAKAAGFRFIYLTITNVDVWGTAKEAVQDAVNAWILSTGATIADQVIDLDEIGDTHPEFIDPTDSTYYVDGTHHNDAGRALIADHINSMVAEPTYTPF